jgi:predicted nuclease with TOPRIM domain
MSASLTSILEGGGAGASRAGPTTPDRPVQDEPAAENATIMMVKNYIGDTFYGFLKAYNYNKLLNAYSTVFEEKSSPTPPPPPFIETILRKLNGCTVILVAISKIKDSSAILLTRRTSDRKYIRDIIFESNTRLDDIQLGELYTNINTILGADFVQTILVPLIDTKKHSIIITSAYLGGLLVNVNNSDINLRAKLIISLLKYANESINTSIYELYNKEANNAELLEELDRISQQRVETSFSVSFDPDDIRRTNSRLAELINTEQSGTYLIPNQPHVKQLQRATILNEFLSWLYEKPDVNVDRATLENEYDRTTPPDIETEIARKGADLIALLGDETSVNTVLTMNYFTQEAVNDALTGLVNAYNTIPATENTEQIIRATHALKSLLKQHAAAIMDEYDSVPTLEEADDNNEGENNGVAPIGAPQNPPMDRTNLTSLRGAPPISRQQGQQGLLIQPGENQNIYAGLLGVDGQDDRAAAPPTVRMSNALPAISGALPREYVPESIPSDAIPPSPTANNQNEEEQTATNAPPSLPMNNQALNATVPPSITAGPPPIIGQQLPQENTTLQGVVAALSGIASREAEVPNDRKLPIVAPPSVPPPTIGQQLPQENTTHHDLVAALSGIASREAEVPNDRKQPTVTPPSVPPPTIRGQLSSPTNTPIQDLVAALSGIASREAEVTNNRKSTITDDIVGTLAGLSKKPAEAETPVEAQEKQAVLSDLVAVLAGLSTTEKTPVEPSLVSTVNTVISAPLESVLVEPSLNCDTPKPVPVGEVPQEASVPTPTPQVVPEAVIPQVVTPAVPGIDTSRVQNLVAVLAGLRSGQPAPAATPTSQPMVEKKSSKFPWAKSKKSPVITTVTPQGSAVAPVAAPTENASSLVAALSELNRPGATTPAVATRANRLTQFMQRQQQPKPPTTTRQAPKGRPSLFPTRQTIMAPVSSTATDATTTATTTTTSVAAPLKSLAGTTTPAPDLAANAESDLSRLVAEFAAFKKTGADKIQGEIKALKAELRTAEALPKSQRETDAVRTRREELKVLIAQYDEQLKKLQRNLASIDSKGMIALLEQKRDALKAELDLLSAGEYLDIFGDLYHTRIIHPVDTEYTMPSLGSVNQLFANYRMTIYKPDKLKRVLEVLSKYFNRNSPTFTMLATECPSEDLRIIMPLFYNRLATLEQQIIRSSFAASPMTAAQTTPSANFYREIYDKLKEFISTMETVCGTRIPRTLSRREAVEEYLDYVLTQSLFAATEAFLHHIFSSVEAGTLRTELGTVKGQLETAQAELEAAKARADELATKSDEQLAKVKELSNAKDLSEENRKQLVKDIQQLNRDKTELNRRMIASLRALTAKQEAVANEEANNASSTIAVENSQERQVEMVENLDAIIGELENDNAELEERIKQLDGWMEEGKDEIEGLEEEIGLLEDELVAANATIAELQADLETMRRGQMVEAKPNGMTRIPLITLADPLRRPSDTTSTLAPGVRLLSEQDSQAPR